MVSTAIDASANKRQWRWKHKNYEFQNVQRLKLCMREHLKNGTERNTVAFFKCDSDRKRREETVAEKKSIPKWIRTDDDRTNNNNISDDMCNSVSLSIQTFDIFSSSSLDSDRIRCAYTRARHTKNVTSNGANDSFMSFGLCAALWSSCTSGKRTQDEKNGTKICDRCTSINSFGEAQRTTEFACAHNRQESNEMNSFFDCVCVSFVKMWRVASFSA